MEVLLFSISGLLICSTMVAVFRLLFIRIPYEVWLEEQTRSSEKIGKHN